MTNKNNIKQRAVERCVNLSISLPMWLIFKIDNATKESERSKFIKYAIMKELGLSSMIEGEIEKDKQTQRMTKEVIKEIKNQ